MSLGLYWRLSLLLAPVLCVIVAVIAGLVLGAVDPARKSGFFSTAGWLAWEILRVTALIAGVGFAVWSALFLVATRRYSAPRLREAMWLAPLHFALVQIAVLFAFYLWKRDILGDFTEGKGEPEIHAAIAFGSLGVFGLLGAYLCIAVAFALEAILRRRGWLGQDPAEARPKAPGG